MCYRQVFDNILDVFRPSAIVLQCGADSLSGDKLGGLGLTTHSHAHCVQYVRSKNIPVMLLGGGGYTVRNVACVDVRDRVHARHRARHRPQLAVERVF